MTRLTRLLMVLALAAGPAIRAHAQGAFTVPPAPAPPGAQGQETPPPLPQRPPTTFFVALDGQPTGPLTVEQVGELIRGGKVLRNTLVWKPGSPDWVEAFSVTELKPLFETAPPSLPEASRYERLMLGTWEARSEYSGVETVVNTTFTSDGAVRGAKSLTMIGAGLPPTVSPFRGRWKVQRLEEGRFVLTITVPNEPQSNRTVKVIDEMTLESEADGQIINRVQ